MLKWDKLRRARFNVRPSSRIAEIPSVINTLIDEIRANKKELEELKRKLHVKHLL